MSKPSKSALTDEEIYAAMCDDRDLSVAECVDNQAAIEKFYVAR